MTIMNIAPSSLAQEKSRSDEECSRIAIPIGSGFRYACLSLRESERRAVVALRALDLTLAEITDTRADAQIARRKLDWWRNALHQAISQHKTEHPILQALLAVTDHPTLQELVPGLESRLGAAVIELDYQGFETQSDLNAYLAAAGGAMFGLYARVILAPIESHSALGTLGAVHHRLHRLTYLGRHAQRGHIYLPAETLAAAGATEADFHRMDAAERLAPLLRNELSEIEGQYRDTIDRLRSVSPRPSTLFRALIALDRAQMALLRHHDVQVLVSRPETPPFKRLVTAWWGSKRPLPK